MQRGSPRGPPRQSLSHSQSEAISNKVFGCIAKRQGRCDWLGLFLPNCLRFALALACSAKVRRPPENKTIYRLSPMLSLREKKDDSQEQ
jgi:hypothetical protein